MTTIKDCQLMLGDCLERMSEIPDGSIDMILADLPYGTTRCKWDVVISFEPLWAHYWRVIKNNGAIALFGVEPFSSHLRMSQINQFKYDWIWKKQTATCHTLAKCKPMPKHELISVFSTGSTYHKHRSKNPMPYFPQGLIPGKNKIMKASKKFTDVNYNKTPNKFCGDYLACEFSNYPNSIIEIKFNKLEKRVHPTQKPVALLEYLIRTYTNEGEIVLDNVMGSGSTGVACLNTGRRFIGIEKDPSYFAIATKRLKEAVNGQTTSRV